MYCFPASWFRNETKLEQKYGLNEHQILVYKIRASLKTATETYARAAEINDLLQNMRENVNAEAMKTIEKLNTRVSRPQISDPRSD